MTGFMSNRKALFFDVDGTLLSERTGLIPESARNALLEARSNGHLIFINSGRTHCSLGEVKRQIQADGYLCGCGTQVIVGDREIYRYFIPHEEGVRMKRDILACGLDGVLEGAESCYMRREPSRFEGMERLRRSLAEKGVLSPYSWEEDCYEFDKCYLASDAGSNCQALFSRMSGMDVIDRGEGYYECVPAGHSKATAIQQVLDYYGLPLSAAYVFGDSSNDLAMFEYAENCIVMGEHSPVLDPYATFVTRSVEEHGIAYALEQLGIVRRREHL